MQEDYKKTPNKRSSSQQRRLSINVQQYKTKPFKQPEDLQSSDNDSLIEQFEEKVLNGDVSQIRVEGQRKKLQEEIEQQSIDKSRNELILQFKVGQLQKICTTLTSANERLLDKIEQLQQQNDRFKNRIVSLQQEVHKRQIQKQKIREELFLSDVKLNESIEQNQQNFMDDLQQKNIMDETSLKLEEEVGDIQKLIQDYRLQLKKSQQINKNSKQTYQLTIKQLSKQFQQVTNKLTDTQTLNSQLQEQLLQMQQKNQTLQTQIQSIIVSNNLDYYQDKRTDSKSSQYQTPMQQRRLNHPRDPRVYNNNYFVDQDQYAQLSPFDSSVQFELQKLIQKLVKQLEYERGMKKKMTDEMKRIQRDLLQSQKQIMRKNKRIYELEMNMLRGQKLYLSGNNSYNNGAGYNYSNGVGSRLNESRNKEHERLEKDQGKNINDKQRKEFNSPGNRDKIRSILEKSQSRMISSQQNSEITKLNQSKHQKMNNYNQQIKSTNSNNTFTQKVSNTNSPKKLLQTFTLLQLLNQSTITLNIAEKLHISLQIVSLYEQKIYQHKNYSLLMLQNIIITNFNRINIRLIKIRFQDNNDKLDQKNKNKTKKNNSKINDQQTNGPQKSIWNMGFILNNLFIDVDTIEKDFGTNQNQKRILEEIQNLLDNRSLNRQVFKNLKQYLEQAFKQRSVK